METVGEILAHARGRDGRAFDAPGRATAYSDQEFCTTAWKAGNLLRQYGVRTGSRVGVVVGPKTPGRGDEPGYLQESAEPLLAALGATAIGGVVVFDLDVAFEGDALVTPAAWVDRYEPGPSCTQFAYGGPPEAADVVHFEQATWSQNPVEPPEIAEITPDHPAVADEVAHGHGDLLDAAATVAATNELTAGGRVGVHGRLDPDVFVAGVLAPLVAGATIVGGVDHERLDRGTDGSDEGAVDLLVGAGGTVRSASDAATD